MAEHGDDRNANNSNEPDAKGLFGSLFPKRQSGSMYQTLSTMLESEEYDMRPTCRRKCVIFNNKIFEPHTRLSERRGTDLDASNLKTLFGTLGFDILTHENLPARDMLYELDKLGKEDYSDSDCFVCCILTHGDMDVLYGKDSKFPVDNIFEPFRGDVCPSLVGKPKLFFIQACRGDRLDEGVPVVMDTSDAPTRTLKIPTHADFLAFYSTVPGFYSWRNTTQGSWFIQSLCQVLQEHADRTDLLSMLTIVCRRVAFYYESNVPGDQVMDRKKQVPSLVSTLTRRVHLRRQFCRQLS